NGYSITVSQPIGEGTQDYTVSFSVRYVSPLDFEIDSASETTAKSVTVVTRAVEVASDRPPMEITLDVPLTPAKLFLHQ
ncbi:MAG: hypothetical protein AAGN64_04645, partial [Bacteroidota bacterium]